MLENNKNKWKANIFYNDFPMSSQKSEIIDVDLERGMIATTEDGPNRQMPSG